MFAAFSFKLNKVLEPKEIESNYTGIHLNETYEEGDFVSMIESFNEGRIIHAKYALQILKSAIAIFERMPNVTVADSRNDDSSFILVCHYLYIFFRLWCF